MYKEEISSCDCTRINNQNELHQKVTLPLFLCSFLPDSPEGCGDIVFTHGIWMGSQAGGLWEKVCPGCISEIIMCRKLILGRDIG